MSRSTRLNILDKHCPWALKLHDDGVPRGGEIRYNVGKAAHAVLQDWTTSRPTSPELVERAAEAVAESLIGKGSSFDGVPEPPMTPGDAMEGRDLAVQHYYYHGLPPIGRPELGLGMDEHGKVAPYATAFLKAAIDLEWIDDMGDDEDPFPVVVVRDYKSAWPAGEGELATLQRKIQAVLAWAHHREDAAAVRMEVINLRTGARYDRTIFFDEEGEALLEEWLKDILMACRALERIEQNPIAAPGAGCWDCPWAYRCEFCMDAAVIPEPADPPSIALAYAAAQARRDALIVMAKKAAAEGDIEIHDGYVGYFGQNERVFKPGAGKVILDYWLEGFNVDLGEARPLIESLLNALKPGGGCIESLGKVLFPGRGAGKVADFKALRGELEEACLDTKVTPVFSVRRKKQVDEEGGG